MARANLFRDLAQYLLDNQFTLWNGAGPEDTGWSVCSKCFAADFSTHEQDCAVGKLVKDVEECFPELRNPNG